MSVDLKYKDMKRALLIIGVIVIFFIGCKKDDVLEASRVEMNGVDIKIGWDYMKMSGEYSYPLALESMKLYLSEKEDLSAAKVYECTLDEEAFSVDVKDLKDGVTYYYCYEYDNGYTQVKSEKESFKTVGKPIVVTKDVGGITKSSAVLSGSVTNNDAANKIKERGFCWGKNPNPTISGSHNNNGSSSGTGTTGFSYNLTNLTSGTKYYVRTYIVTDFGVLYGNEKSFVTTGEQPEEPEEPEQPEQPEIVLPTVTTSDVTNITSNSAACGGNVTSDGGGTVIARGVCWSTSQTPTINDFRTANGTGTGTFTSNITGLNPNTKYYVRAYATNEAGTSYGAQKSFTTLGDVTVTEPTVSTNTVSSITANTAICGGNVTSDGGGTVTARGVCWSTSQNPTISNNRSIDGIGTGNFISNLSNLAPQTTYYVRAYATNEAGTSYGAQKSFTTLDEEPEETISGTENGHDYVDLGLSVKWANCNIGANKPEEYGDYFAWGETTTKSDYLSSNCPTYGLSHSELKSQGYMDNEYKLTLQYDAARTNWGGDWRMPTYDELIELIDNCTWTWTTQNGVNGYKVTSKTNGNSIFLPAAGYRNGSSLYIAGSDGRYWSSATGANGACSLRFFSSNHGMGNDDRYFGLSVRPVFGGNFTGPEEQPEIVLPTVSTNSVSSITANTAICGGNVTSDGGGTVTARGVCWSETSEPKINNLYSEVSYEGTGTGSFTSSMINLKANTTYYVRAYATNEAGTVYGEVKSFKTLDEEPEIVLPTVTTNSVTNITSNSATCGGNVTSDGNGTVTARGICWSETSEPKINNLYSEESNNGTGTGSFTSSMTNLKANTTYYVRAYATNEAGTSYGEVKSFTTRASTGTENGYGWVDLGLSVKWATCNVGADSPEEYGDYFAWGETSPKSDYSSSNSATYGLSNSELQSQGYIDSEGNLTAQYDAATANWGGSWRMPTSAEQEELFNNCTWTWTTYNGVKGYNVEGPNGHSIFLPAAGYRRGSSLNAAGGLGDYWSSSPYEYDGDRADILDFSSSGKFLLIGYRYDGQSVRPVSE